MSEPLSEPVGLRLSKKLKDRMDICANELATPPSTYIREAIREKVMRDEVKIAEHKKATK